MKIASELKTKRFWKAYIVTVVIVFAVSLLSAYCLKLAAYTAAEKLANYATPYSQTF